MDNTLDTPLFDLKALTEKIKQNIPDLSEHGIAAIQAYALRRENEQQMEHPFSIGCWEKALGLSELNQTALATTDVELSPTSKDTIDHLYQELKAIAINCNNDQYEIAGRSVCEEYSIESEILGIVAEFILANQGKTISPLEQKLINIITQIANDERMHAQLTANAISSRRSLHDAVTRVANKLDRRRLRLLTNETATRVNTNVQDSTSLIRFITDNMPPVITNAATPKTLPPPAV